MEMKDLFGLSQPLGKLIDVVSCAVGRISKSYFDKKDVRTEMYKIKQLAVAQAEAEIAVKKIMDENNPPALIAVASENVQLEVRTQERLNYQESKRQLNIENVTAFAANELIGEKSVTEEPLNEDWATRFFRIVEDVSNEDMQVLWGKILAGEIKQPNSFSLRTLEIMKNLSQKEATVFAKVANYAISSGSNSDYCFFEGNDRTTSERLSNIRYSDIALLTEVGLIQSGDFTQHQLLERAKDREHFFFAGNYVMKAEIKANTPTISMPINAFSSAGSELMKLIVQNTSIDYLTYIANSIKKEGFVDVKYSTILSWNGSQFNHTPWKNFE